jgi:hypothetical protein
MEKNIIFFLLAALCLLYPLPAAAIAPPTTAIDYQLPYPGILPDSPLYNLKIIRDKVLGFFISNPVKKAEYDINMADVRISAALALADQKKDTPLAKTTISKAQNYQTEAMVNIRIAKSQGIDTQSLVKKLNQAKGKYKEVASHIELIRD